ncbi:MAG: hypothetical protein LDL31_06475 [Prosthecobacter sp.]|jgi:hypothetical protein|nr:hypothetical protein [Prosthecobacter sp.]
MKTSRPISALLLLLFPLLLAQGQEVPPPEPGIGPDAPTVENPSFSQPEATLPEASPALAEASPASGIISEPEDAEPIPRAFGIERYQASWEKNPFLLKTTPIAQPTVNWGQDWALAGMFSYNGRIRVSIRNKQTNEFERITNENESKGGFRLIKANFSRNRKEASVVIAKGSQEAELKYDDSAAPVTINNTMRAPAGANAAAGAVPQPGGVPQPGKPVSPTQAARPVVPGAPVGLPGAGVQPAVVPQPGMVSPQPAPATPPSISRRRQLIPAPVIPPAGNP